LPNPARRNRFACLGGGVAAVHQPQAGIVERLDADGKAVDARLAQRFQIGPVEVVRIGFEGRFLHSRAVVKVGRAGQQVPDLLWREQRRGAAAEIAGADRFAAQVAAPRFQLAVHRRQHVVHAPQVGALVEVAVGADAFAERYVEIKACHRLSNLRKNSVLGALFGRKSEPGHKKRIRFRRIICCTGSGRPCREPFR
jgi:hypothetical protein